MKRPGYREAVEWIAGNDDCHYIVATEHCPAFLSVAMSLVRDLWDVTDERLTADILRALKRIHQTHEALR
jgi:hypothetical protein